MKNLYIPLLALATCCATQVEAKVKDLLPRPQKIEATQGASPFYYNATYKLQTPLTTQPFNVSWLKRDVKATMGLQPKL